MYHSQQVTCMQPWNLYVILKIKYVWQNRCMGSPHASREHSGNIHVSQSDLCLPMSKFELSVLPGECWSPLKADSFIHYWHLWNIFIGNTERLLLVRHFIMWKEANLLMQFFHVSLRVSTYHGIYCTQWQS